MFELPNAKRVRRSDAFDTPPSSPSASSSPPPRSPDQLIHSAKLPQLELTFEDKTPHDKSSPKPVPSADNEEEGAYAFQLFRSPAQPKPHYHRQQKPAHDEQHNAEKDGADGVEPSLSPILLPPSKITRINIRSPTPPSPGSGGFVNPHRPRSYYFTFSTAAAANANASGKDSLLHTAVAAEKEYAAVAVDGLDVRARARSVKWPGTALPFRVIHINIPPTSTSFPSFSSPPHHTHTPPDPNKKLQKCRASKKHRIALRKKLKLAVAAEQRTREEAEADRGKRTRRNREKKVKRRERERVVKKKRGERVDGDGDGAGENEGE
ncbi:MAG: hypothetical protein Q9160_005664 [Pyrenula sp. 1 TL-2023]